MLIMTTPLTPPVNRAIKSLATSLELARRRRGLSQADLAERMGVSISTVRRMENGNPGTAIQYIASALQVFGELDKLHSLMDTAQDPVGLSLMDAELPARVHSKRHNAMPKAF